MTNEQEARILEAIDDASGGGGTGHGIPDGGTTGQVLTKSSGSDYDADWATPSALSISTATVTLVAADWGSSTNVVTVTGMTTTAKVWVSPAGTSADTEAYASAKIFCSAQGSGSLTFTCGTTPTTNIDVNVMWVA